MDLAIDDRRKMVFLKEALETIMDALLNWSGLVDNDSEVGGDVNDNEDITSAALLNPPFIITRGRPYSTFLAAKP